MLLFLILFGAQFSLAGATSVRDSFQNGHNLTITSDTLPAGHCSIGIPVTACGITDGISLGVSPWMYLDYYMWGVAARVLLDEDPDQNRFALQANYFKTYKDREDAGNIPALSHYQMEAVWLMLIRTWNISPTYRLHLNTHLNYYFDEKLPFSLRRPYLKPTPWQVNLSLLHEVNLAAGWFIYGEMGLIDILRDPIHIHGGASLGKVFGGLSVRAGFSLTGTGSALFSPTARRDYQQSLRFSSLSGYEAEKDAPLVRYDYGLHPEFSVQYTF